MATLVKDLIASRLKVLSYGRAGTGKTRFTGSAASFAETAPALMLTIGGNPVSLLRYEKKPTVVAIDDMKDFNAIYEYFSAGQPQSHPLGAWLSAMEQFKTLIIDGGSEVNAKVVDNILGQKSNRSFAENYPKMEIADYGKNLATMGNWGSRFFSLADANNILPVHVFMTALEREPAPDLRSAKAKAEGVTPPPPGSSLYRPAFLGQAAGAIESYAYITMRMLSVARLDLLERKATGTYKRASRAWNVGYVTAGEDYVAKDQYGKLGDYLVDPTVEQVWRLIYDKA